MAADHFVAAHVEVVSSYYLWSRHYLWSRELTRRGVGGAYNLKSISIALEKWSGSRG